jgi:peptidoglycan/LPS O-acetylase OafA/YrhL
MHARGSSGPSRLPFRSDIEGMRGFAVLVVVLYHAGIPLIGGGFIGVDVFFVLSGYLITQLLVSENSANGRIDFWQFYARRARRLLPASSVMVVTVLLLSLITLSPPEVHEYARTGASASAYLSNFWFIRRSSDYFAVEAAANPFLHTWSLAVEEQFYLVWPAIIAVALRYGRRTGLLAVLVLMAVASFASAVWLTTHNPPVAFYSSPARAWEFAAGGLAGILPQMPVSRVRHTLVGWAGLMSLCLVAFLYTAEMPYPGIAALVPTVATVAMLRAGAGTVSVAPWIMQTRPAMYLGRISYSWYLWHWPFMVLAVVAFPELGGRSRALAAVMALAAASLTYVLLEHPIRHYQVLLTRPRRTVAYAVGLSVLCIGIGEGTRRYGKVAAESPNQVAFTRAAIPSSAMDRQDCLVLRLAKTMSHCVFGAGDSSIVLYGDSHSAHWFPAIEKIAQANGYRVVTFTRAGCPAVDVPMYSPELKRSYPECEESRQYALRNMRRFNPAMIVMSNAQAFVATGDSQRDKHRISEQDWREGYRRALERVAKMSPRVVVIHDVPRMPARVPVCLARLPARQSECEVPRRQAFNSRAMRAEQAAVRSVAGVEYVDLTDEYCDAGTCYAVRDGIVVYRDADHLATAFAAHLAPRLAEALGMSPPR